MIRADRVDQETIKDGNYKKILTLLQKERAVTKQAISREIGVSLPTVITHINQLIKEGIVEEAGLSVSSGGRKPVIVKFKPDARYAFGVEFSSSHISRVHYIRIVLINLDSTIKYDVSFDYQEFDNVDGIIRHIHDLCRGILSQKGISRERILGIGFSLPGTVNEDKKILEQAPNIDPKFGMKDLDFKKYESLFPFPLLVENEANASAFAELILGVAKRKRNLIFLSVNRGIGAGIVVREHIYKGSNKRAGEFGHMTVASLGNVCTCGRKDCWELYAASGALIRGYNKASTEKLTDTKEFLAKLNSGDPDARATWEKYLDYLAVGIDNILLFFDPHYIVLGGEICLFEEIILEPLKARLFRKNSYYTSEDLKILMSRLKENSAVLGAALLPLQKLFYLNTRII
ncbi:MAG: ROK family transcriptional regulator [Spirochaetota bacterium]